MGDELLVVRHAKGSSCTLNREKSTLVLGAGDHVMMERLENLINIFCI